MGPPPPKRQKRLADLSPEDDVIEQSLAPIKSKTTSKVTSSKLKRPTRSTSKITQSKQPLDDWTVREDSPTKSNGSKVLPSTKSPPDKQNSLRLTQTLTRSNGDRKGALHAFLSKQSAIRPVVHSLLKPKAPIAEEVEQEDDIEDISDYDPDEPEQKVIAILDPPSKSTRLVLDRRKPNEDTINDKNTSADLLSSSS